MKCIAGWVPSRGWSRVGWVASFPSFFFFFLTFMTHSGAARTQQWVPVQQQSQRTHDAGTSLPHLFSFLYLFSSLPHPSPEEEDETGTRMQEGKHWVATGESPTYLFFLFLITPSDSKTRLERLNMRPLRQMHGALQHRYVPPSGFPLSHHSFRH